MCIDHLQAYRAMILKRFFICSLLLCSQLCLAEDERIALYQVDMIVFEHTSTLNQLEQNTTPLLPQASKNATPLKTTISSDMTPYHLLPPSSSRLQSDYLRLNKLPDYRVLAHYSWLQPNSSKQTLRLPDTQEQGWTMRGEMRIKKTNYYALNINLLLSKDRPESTVLLSQYQRLQPNVVYYLDHPHVGMLVTIHEIS